MTSLSSAGELGRPLLQVFSNPTYTRIQMPSAPVQDTDGRLYFGDFSAALVFDGTAWNAVEMPFAKLVAPLARAPDGTLYGGGHQRLGWFKRGPGNNYDFVALESRLDPADREFGDVQAIAALDDDTVCFAATRKLLLWRDGRFTTIDHGGSTAWSVGRTLFLHAPGAPLQRLDHGRLVVASNDPFFRDARLTFILPGDRPAAFVMGSLDQGLFELSGGKVTPLATAVDGRLRSERLLAGARLADASLALGLASGDVIVLDREGQFLSSIGPARGLVTSPIRALGTDLEHGLWICQATQLTRVQWPSAVTLFDDRTGLPNAPVRSVLRHDGSLYVSTIGGVYRLVSTAVENAEFVAVPGGTGNVQALVEGPTGLLAITLGQVFELSDGAFQPVLALPPRPPGFAYAVRRSVTNPERVWIGQPDGIRSIVHRGNGWIDEGPLAGFQRAAVELLELPDGTLWVANYTDGFARLEFEHGGNDPRGAVRVHEYYGGHGLPQKLAANNRVVLWQNAPLFSTDYGAYRFDPEADRFVAYREVGAQLNQPPLVIASIVPTAPDHFWMRAYTTPPGPGELRGRRFYRVPRHGAWEALPHYANDAAGAGSDVFEEVSDGRLVAWIQGTRGLIRVDEAAAFATSEPWPVVVTAEASAPGETWTDEMPSVDATDPRVRSNDIKPVPAQWMGAGARIPFGRHDLRFHFFAPRMQLGSDPEYQTFLEGYDRTWTGLRSDRSRTVTNLTEGRYTLRVRAQDSDGRFTPEATLAFVVLPPWWRTWWAFTGYAALAAGVLVLTVRWRLRILRERNEQLEATVALRTTELRTSEAELRVARDAADTANRAKSAFLANMSHELRTPLNSILGYTQIMQRECPPGDRNARRLEHVVQSGEHLLRLINDVLDLSKVEAGRIELVCRPCALRKLVGGVAEFFQTRASQAGLGFSLVQPTPLPEWVLADEHRLRQVLSNLLGNALKFTERGEIELRVELVDARRPDPRVPGTSPRLRFAVRDTGIGIAPDDRTRIFAPFQQSALPHLAAQGAGLGLAISQRLVHLMGGQLEVESTPGHGSRFWFEIDLPLASDPSPAPLARTVIGYRGDRRRILVVDDEAANRALLRDLLTGLTFEVGEARDAAEALAACVQAKPHAVLLDLRMPEVDGFALAPRLRRVTPGPLTIIALSASVYPVDREQALAAGCDEFLGKPINEPDLFEALGRLLGIEWIFSEARPPESDAATPFASLPLPKPGQLDELLALAECGDVLKLTELLQELRHADPQLIPFAQRIESLAANFQTRAVIDALQKARPPAETAQ